MVAAAPLRPRRLRRDRPRRLARPARRRRGGGRAGGVHAAERAGDTIGADELPRGSTGSSSSTRGSPARWRGEPNPVDRVPGRIPGALNAPWNEPLPAAARGRVVAYCGSGVTACVTLHRLALAGREGRLYPGSWSEWEQRPELPRRARLTTGRVVSARPDAGVRGWQARRRAGASGVKSTRGASRWERQEPS